MRLIRYILMLVLALWALASLYIFNWFRERYGRGGPIPVAQAQTLLHPRREWIHPVRETLAKFRIRPGDTVLEIGPGPGYFTVGAARAAGESGRVIALDIQRGMLQMLQSRLDEADVREAQPVWGDATRLPLVDASADVAYLVAVLGEIPDRPAALKEVRRVLKPDGLLAISETLTDPDYQFVDTVRDLCRALGFEPVEHAKERLGYTLVFRSPGG